MSDGQHHNNAAHPPVEAESGLLSSVASDATSQSEAVAAATTESHHGLVREAGPKLSREEEAKLALEHTVIKPSVARLMTALFLFTILSVPLIQHVAEIRSNLAARREEAAAGQVPQGRVLPQSFDIVDVLPSREAIGQVRSAPEAWQLLPDPQSIKDYEATLEDTSVVAQWILPRTQHLLTRHLGVGNEKAYLGRGNWLFYAPDVDYLTSRGFLDPSLLQVRLRSGGAETAQVQPDPLRAIVDFKQQLAARGIQLILMPTPVKTMMHAEKMSAGYEFDHELLQNPSYDDFRRQLEANNVLLFDVSQSLHAAKRRTRQPQYLETDTHWTPDAMELAARELAAFIKATMELPPHEVEGYTRVTQQVSNMGDIADMLKLSPNQTLYQKQRVSIRQVQTPDGEPWYSTRAADILLLGDSFSNIYSLGGMNWGESAGFGEQISYYLQRPLDMITNNAGGSHVTRQLLANDLARGRDRLRGKRVVIWQFSMRDLLVGDWQLINLSSRKKQRSAAP
jgi:alginate O-acetyltransferase complex protein AlgJ